MCQLEIMTEVEINDAHTQNWNSYALTQCVQVAKLSTKYAYGLG